VALLFFSYFFLFSFLFSFDFWFENFYKTSNLNLSQILKFVKTFPLILSLQGGFDSEEQSNKTRKGVQCK
jgi:hypothetical protein